MKSREKSPPAEAEGPLDRSIRLRPSAGRPVGRPAGGASAGRPAVRLDGPVPAAAGRVSVGDSAGRPVGRLDHLGRPAARLDLDCSTLETSPDRGMAPQNSNESWVCWFRSAAGTLLDI